MTAETLSRISKGDEVAFSEIYNEYCNKVYSIAYSVVKDDFDAEDIMQEVFISLPQKLETLNDEKTFDFWLYRMTKNKALDFLRKNKPAVFSEFGSEDDEYSFEDTIENENRDFQPEESLDYSETKQIIGNIVDSLPEEQRECVLLRFEKGLSLQEIADATGTSVATVKSRLKYGKAKIEEAVKEEEKKGTKLYGVSGFMLIPFLRWLFGNGASASSALLSASSLGAAGTASAATSAIGSASTAAAAASAVGGATKAASVSALTKGIIAGVLSVVIAATATVAVINSEPAFNDSVNTGSGKTSSATESQIPPTEGLKYTLLADGTYSVSVGTARGVAEIVIPSKYEGKAVTVISLLAFDDCTNLTSITIPKSVTSIGDGAFRNCTSLTSITIPNSVTSIGNDAFNCCTSLTSVTIGNSVTSIGDRAFRYCTSLKSVTIPNSVTSIGYNAFYNCKSLKSITIPNSVTSIGGLAFEYCTSLTSITIPDSVTSIGSLAFNGTAWYENQPDGLVYAGKVAYKYKGTCPETIAIKDGTKGIAGGAFYNCKSLKSITIPNSVTSIGDRAFYDCYNLTSITIPNSVTSIGDDAFSYCTSLTSITYQGTKAEWEQFRYVWQYTQYGTIHCTDGDLTY